jgi:hypothetical protein
MVSGVRPVIGSAAETGLVPAPALRVGVTLPYAVVPPYSKLYVVAQPSGLTLPRSVASVAVTAAGARVTTDGAGALPGTQLAADAVAAPIDPSVADVAAATSTTTVLFTGFPPSVILQTVTWKR